MVFEICTDSVEGAMVAGKFGAKRIELCTALSVGGLTPSYGLIKQCVEKSSVEVHVMIRHKEGGFNYSQKDVDLMKLDIEAAKKAGAHGAVFGVLNNNKQISELNKELILLSKSLGLETTFHRAFDFTPNYKQAIEQIIEYGFDRLLTSGMKPSAELGLNTISELVLNYGSDIQIMAGSGINASNALKIAKSGINNIHFTARKARNIVTGLSMGELFAVDEDKIKSIITQFK